MSGRSDIVDQVSAADNNVLVSQLAGNREFRAWLDSAGITLAEAGRIQVPYMGGERECEPFWSRAPGKLAWSRRWRDLGRRRRRRAAVRVRAREAARASVTPLLVTERGSAAGLSVSIRF